MRKRTIVFRALLISLAMLGMVVGPALAGCLSNCGDVAPCCEPKPEVARACCAQDAPVESSTPGRQGLCDCDHGPEGPAVVTQAVSGSSVEVVQSGPVEWSMAIPAHLWVRGSVQDEQWGPPVPLLFLLDCAYLI